MKKRWGILPRGFFIARNKCHRIKTELKDDGIIANSVSMRYGGVSIRFAKYEDKMVYMLRYPNNVLLKNFGRVCLDGH